MDTRLHSCYTQTHAHTEARRKYISFSLFYSIFPSQVHFAMPAHTQHLMGHHLPLRLIINQACLPGCLEGIRGWRNKKEQTTIWPGNKLKRVCVPSSETITASLIPLLRWEPISTINRPPAEAEHYSAYRIQPSYILEPIYNSCLHITETHSTITTHSSFSLWIPSSTILWFQWRNISKESTKHHFITTFLVTSHIWYILICSP